MPKVKLTAAIGHPDSPNGIAKAGTVLDVTVPEAANLIHRGRAELVKGESLQVADDADAVKDAEPEKVSPPKRVKK